MKRNIRIPRFITEELAEDVGYHIGDGYMKERKETRFHQYNFVYAGHSVEDKNYFEKILIPRKKRLFNINLHYRKYSKRTKKSIELVFNSKAILTFYRDVLKVRESPKINVKVPDFIFYSTALKKGFIRGLIDSDGCLTFLRKHKKVHYYPVIRFGTRDKTLFNDVKKIMNDLNFKFVAFRFEQIDKRTGKSYVGYRIELNGVLNLHKWLEDIGFNNQKHVLKYKKWARGDSNSGNPQT